MDKQIYRSNGNESKVEEKVSAYDRQQITGSERQAHSILNDPAFESRFTVVFKDDALVAKQLLKREAHRATRADIFRASELLFDESVELGFRLTACLLMWYGDVSNATENDTSSY